MSKTCTELGCRKSNPDYRTTCERCGSPLPSPYDSSNNGSSAVSGLVGDVVDAVSDMVSGIDFFD